MKSATISCDSCERLWTVATTFSIYEQQALESCPCPHCGACTLRCQDGLETGAGYSSWREVAGGAIKDRGTGALAG